MGLLPGRGFVVNPTVEEQALSSLDLVMAGTSEAVLMIEGFCDFLSEEQMVEVGGWVGAGCRCHCPAAALPLPCRWPAAAGALLPRWVLRCGGCCSEGGLLDAAVCMGWGALAVAPALHPHAHLHAAHCTPHAAAAHCCAASASCR